MENDKQNDIAIDPHEQNTNEDFQNLVDVFSLLIKVSDRMDKAVRSNNTKNDPYR